MRLEYKKCDACKWTYTNDPDADNYMPAWGQVQALDGRIYEICSTCQGKLGIPVPEITG